MLRTIWSLYLGSFGKLEELASIFSRSIYIVSDLFRPEPDERVVSAFRTHDRRHGPQQQPAAGYAKYQRF